MLDSTAISGLRQSIEEAEAGISALMQDLKNKRSELRRYRKALAVLSAEAPKTRRKRGELESNVSGSNPELNEDNARASSPEAELR
jgi:chromosome segregation ATPase